MIDVINKDKTMPGNGGEFSGNRSDIISRTVLASAIQRSFKSKNTEESLENNVAIEMAEHVLNFFGFGERIIDNMLKTDDRDIFYMLEDLGILKTEREETTLYDGREWRINYWTMSKHYIASLIDTDYHDLGGNLESVDPYEELPDDVWMRE